MVSWRKVTPKGMLDVVPARAAQVGPTSVALGKDKIYVLSTAYLLTGPVILVADFDSERHTAHR
ncbi:hypothetical protein [Streptomyces gibsoniae]|uniref:Uncharacterized protein n=1 Tax=Streptomyces gibsoniae TaxID=3075529 RepID=A0ABU2TMK6_9ACTN|nr:hypothetical protein [Streptomyces sp. DSM 41699]MDT0462171.1 hypothetical protein [Streptomyces sp. DSM 41699]